MTTAALERLEALFDASPDGILLLSAGGEVVARNRRFADLFGPAAEAEAGRLRGAAPSAAASHDEVALPGGGVAERWGTPLAGRDGTPAGHAFFFRDVTERRRAEDEIRRLHEAAVRGQEEERARLAQALHDAAGQALAALLLRLGEAARRARDPALVPEIEAARAIADGLVEELRGLSHALRPASLARLGLPEALRDLAAATASPALAVDVDIDPPAFPALPPEIAVSIFRIAQAALANVVRHAGARRARLRLAERDDAIRFEVEDDGRGFDPAAPRAGAGIGLAGMRERAAWLGGALTVESAPGRGTRIRVDVPFAWYDR